MGWNHHQLVLYLYHTFFFLENHDPIWRRLTRAYFRRKNPPRSTMGSVSVWILSLGMIVSAVWESNVCCNSSLGNLEKSSNVFLFILVNGFIYHVFKDADMLICHCWYLQGCRWRFTDLFWSSNNISVKVFWAPDSNFCDTFAPRNHGSLENWVLDPRRQRIQKTPMSQFPRKTMISGRNFKIFPDLETLWFLVLIPTLGSRARLFHNKIYQAHQILHPWKLVAKGS